MRQLEILRNQHIRLAESLSAQPNIRQAFAVQSKASSPAEVLSLPIVPLARVQRLNGEFYFMLGYDALGDGEL